MNHDMTFCAYAGCPLEDCERHLHRLNDADRPGKDGFSIADFAPVCRQYIAHVVEEVKNNEIIGNIHDNPELLKGGEG